MKQLKDMIESIEEIMSVTGNEVSKLLVCMQGLEKQIEELNGHFRNFEDTNLWIPKKELEKGE